MSHSILNTGIALLILSIAGVVAAPAAAEDGIEIELNRMEDVDDGCRITTVFTNRYPTRIQRLAVEVAIFDREGQVEEMFLLPARPLSSGQTSVRRFGLNGMSCSDIGQVLFNHIAACDGEGLDPEVCSQAVQLSSRAGVPFVSSLSEEQAGAE